VVTVVCLGKQLHIPFLPLARQIEPTNRTQGLKIKDSPRGCELGVENNSLPHGKMTPKNRGVKMQRKVDRKEQLERFRGRYRQRAKEGKGRLLDEFCEHYGYDRKYALKLLRGSAAPTIFVKSPPPGPQPKYEAVTSHCADLESSRAALARVVRALPLWLPHYESIMATAAQPKAFKSVSAATVDRLLAGRRAQGLCGDGNSCVNNCPKGSVE
jgi:hypothetical protein